METPTLPDSQAPMDAVDGTPRLETTALSEQPDNQLGQFSDGPLADDLPADEPTAEEPPAGQAGGKRSESEELQEQVVPTSQDQKVQCQKCLSQVYVYDSQARGKVWWCKPCNAINCAEIFLGRRPSSVHSIRRLRLHFGRDVKLRKMQVEKGDFGMTACETS